MQETIDRFDVQKHIRYKSRVTSASWSSAEAKWTVQIRRGDKLELETVRCQFLFMCTGYYDYAQGYLPSLKDANTFQGQMVHPQHWPTDLSYEGKKILIIGSGATAVTLLPALAPLAEHVTLLQRSPSYIAVRASNDGIANALRALLPLKLASTLIRAKTILMGAYMHRMCRLKPEKAKPKLFLSIKCAPPLPL